MILMFALIILISCKWGESESYFIRTRTIINSSKHEVEIHVFSDNMDVESALLNPAGVYTVTSNCEKIRGNLKCDQEIDWSAARIVEIDSVLLIFGQSKKLIFCNNSDACFDSHSDRNIMSLGNFQRKPSSSSDDVLYTFTITDDDYEKAIPIVE